MCAVASGWNGNPEPTHLSLQRLGQGPASVWRQRSGTRASATSSRACGRCWGRPPGCLAPAPSVPPPDHRFYFKKVSDEFECGVVFEEVREDAAVLPVFEEKVIGKVEKVD